MSIAFCQPPSTPPGPYDECACRKCQSGTLRVIRSPQYFHPPGADTIRVEHLSVRCDCCGYATVHSSQGRENQRRLAARKSAYGGQMLGEEIAAFRRKWGLTLRDASHLFGRRPGAFEAFEKEAAYPDLLTTKLIRLAMYSPVVLRQLADREGVRIPLWDRQMGGVTR